MIDTKRIRKNKEFSFIYKKGRSKADRLLVMYIYENNTDQNRLGISVSKKVGNSVVRHRVKRRVKEIYRVNEDMVLKGYDIVIIGRTAAACADSESLKKSIMFLLKLHHILKVPGEDSI